MNDEELSVPDATLTARLRELASFERGVGVMQDFYCGDEMVAAADRIEQLAATNEALLREKAAAYAQGYGDCEAEISLTEIGRTNDFLHGQIAKWKARAEQLAATNERLEAALREIAKPYAADQSRLIHSNAQIASIARAALKGADHE